MRKIYICTLFIHYIEVKLINDYKNTQDKHNVQRKQLWWENLQVLKGRRCPDSDDYIGEKIKYGKCAQEMELFYIISWFNKTEEKCYPKPMLVNYQVQFKWSLGGNQ